MRLQLIIVVLIGFVAVSVNAQESDTSKINLDDIEVTILTSYYAQDGIHSPVTGGSGTEQLTNVAPDVYVHIPMDTVRELNLNAGVDFYSSASSDNIDNPYISNNHISGASANDIRQHYTLTYGKKNNTKATKKSYTAGLSSEYDVTSLSAGFSFEKENKKKGRGFAFSSKYFFDDWKLIYPVELRSGTKQLLDQDKRNTISLSATETFIINRKMSAALTVEALGQFGMLSTPFHRVYFQDTMLTDVERLPGQRFKVPVGFRLNIHPLDFLILRTFNRVYVDSWGMTGFTSEIETPVKVTEWLRISPFYRYHTQTAADYFKAYGEHLIADGFYTSDYDLSSLSSQKYGVELRIAPVFGLGRFIWSRERVAVFKQLGFRYSNYVRSDGLSAWSLTVGMKFNLHQQ